MYDAINGITQRHHPYLVQAEPPPVPTKWRPRMRQPAQSWRASIQRMRQRFSWPTRRALRTSIPGMSTRALSLTGSPGEIMSRNYCSLTARTTVLMKQSLTYRANPGEWRPHISFGGIVRPALLPQWGTVRCFGIESGWQFRPPPPPALTSQQYADEVNQVRLLGDTNSFARTSDQTEIAQFWANGAGMATPAGRWNQIAQVLAAEFGNSVEDNARLFALLNIACADAAIVSWDCKYAYNFWRPITAIREADTDNNPLTIQDPNRTPLLFTPPFPEYTSGHSTFSGAAAVVLAGFYGRDNIAFSATSDDAPGIVRHYSSLSEAAEESGVSRIYGGIHFWSANVYGLSTGASVGEYVAENLLLNHGSRHDNY